METSKTKRNARLRPTRALDCRRVPDGASSSALPNSATRVELRLARVEAENRALRQGEQRYRQLIESSHDWIWEVDRHVIYTYASAHCRELLGYEPDELLGRTPFDLMPPDEADRVRTVFGAYAAQHLPFRRLENVNRRKDGALVILETNGTPIFDHHRRFQGYRGMDRDITQRKQLEKQILEISEREQQRIGQDLHDELCQLLSGVKFKTTLLEQRLSDRSLPEAAEAKGIERLLNQAIHQARNLARGLHPVDLEARGLMSALQSLAASVESLYRVSCRCEFHDTVLVHDHRVATHLYRIAQEAINNAIKHSRAGRIRILLEQQNGQLTLSVKANGVVFPAPVTGPGLGLHLMHYRARTIGASLLIGPGRTGGTMVVCRWRVPASPLEAATPKTVLSGRRL